MTEKALLKFKKERQSWFSTKPVIVVKLCIAYHSRTMEKHYYIQCLRLIKKMFNNLHEPANNAVLPKALKKQYICRIPEALKLSLAAARINRLAWMKCYATWPRVYNSFMLEPAHKLKWPQSFNWLNSWHLCKMKNSGMAESFFPKQRPVLESWTQNLGQAQTLYGWIMWFELNTALYAQGISSAKSSELSSSENPFHGV